MTDVQNANINTAFSQKTPGGAPPITQSENLRPANLNYKHATCEIPEFSKTYYGGFSYGVEQLQLFDPELFIFFGFFDMFEPW